jgi:hypothetical protein
MDTLRQRLEHIITGSMAMAIIDQLELINMNK